MITTADELKRSLKAARGRNPDAYLIIGAVSGLGDKRVTQIAEGDGKPITTMELTTLCVLAGGE